LPIESRSIEVYFFKNSSWDLKKDIMNITRLISTELIKTTLAPH
jgi:hypothetical protein